MPFVEPRSAAQLRNKRSGGRSRLPFQQIHRSCNLHEHFRNALNWENADAITKSGTGRPRKTYLYALLNMCRLMPPQRSSGSKIEIQLTGVMRAQLEHVTGRYLTSDKPLTDDECSFVVAACCMQWYGNGTSNKSDLRAVGHGIRARDRVAAWRGHSVRPAAGQEWAHLHQSHPRQRRS